MSDWAEERANEILVANCAHAKYPPDAYENFILSVAAALREAEAKGMEGREACGCCRDIGAPGEICSDGCGCSYEASREMQRKRDTGEICAECDGPADERVKAGMKCGNCAYGG